MTNNPTKLTDLPGAKEVLPIKIEGCEEHNSSACSCIPTHNAAVSQIEKVAVVVDVEKMLDIFAYVDVTRWKEKTKTGGNERGLKQHYAQALASSAKDWLKLTAVKEGE